MYKKIKYIIILSIVCLILAGCQRPESATEKPKIEGYESKTYEKMSDKNVVIKQYMEKNKGSLELTFSEKEIPFETKLISGAPTYEGGLNISGSLGEGEVKILVMSSNKYVMWEKTFTSEKLKAKPRFDMYSGEYILRLEFSKAKNGNIKIKFLTAQ